MNVETLIYVISIAILLCLSGFFSGSETALFSLKSWQIRRLETRDRKRSKRISILLARPRNLLITILIGNLMVNVTVSTVAESFCHRIFDENSTLIAILGMTLFLLIFGEITPKLLAVNHARKFSLYISLPLLAFQRMIAPVQHIIFTITTFFMRLFGRYKSPEEMPISREAIHGILDMGTKDGVVDPHEKILISRIFKLGTRRVGQISQDLDTVFSIDEDTPPVTAMEQIMEKGYSRIPVYRGQKEHITGVLYLKDFLPYWLGLKKLSTLKSLIHKPLMIASNQRALNVLRTLRMKKQHMAFITDQKHHVKGIITIQDLVSIIVGKDPSAPDPSHGSGNSGRSTNE